MEVHLKNSFDFAEHHEKANYVFGQNNFDKKVEMMRETEFILQIEQEVL